MTDKEITLEYIGNNALVEFAEKEINKIPNVSVNYEQHCIDIVLNKSKYEVLIRIAKAEKTKSRYCCIIFDNYLHEYCDIIKNTFPYKSMTEKQTMGFISKAVPIIMKNYFKAKQWDIKFRTKFENELTLASRDLNLLLHNKSVDDILSKLD